MEQTASQSKVYKGPENSEVLRWIPDGCRRTLDLGCGSGANAAALKKRGMEVDGITLSEDEASIARAHCDMVFVHNLEDGLPENLTAKYDAVLASHVLEHICYPEKLLQAIASQLKPNGTLVVALPNLLNWKYRFKMLFGIFEYADIGIMDYTHFRWYTLKSARRLLETHGFKVNKAHAHGYFPFFRRRIPRGMLVGLDRLICRLLPGLAGFQLILVATNNDNGERSK
jgi:2-polyprenyl-3-methyl-5-hydroxy-6-metoxy-1,4-benzoquinol methylase